MLLIAKGEFLQNPQSQADPVPLLLRSIPRHFSLQKGARIVKVKSDYLF
jgi:hypothetical protein